MRLVLGLAICVAVFGAAAAQPADWGPRRDPFDRVVIARYEQYLARDPHDSALGKLVDLYRRYRTLALLVSEYETKLAADPDRWELIVVTGRLHEAAADTAGALELYGRALAVHPDDTTTAIRIGKAQRAAGRLALARDAYQHALEHARDPLRADIVRALVEIARADRDPIDVLVLTTRLVELEPRDARAHVERGDALLALGLTSSAADEYARAEPLYGEPARRLDVLAMRGRALERDYPTTAETVYRRAMSIAPRGHYLIEELFERIVALHRKAHTLEALLARSLEDWPEASRGVFEWTELAALYDATGQQASATTALANAVAKSTDPRLHLRLADRYVATEPAKALAIVDRLVGPASRDSTVLVLLAERYIKLAQAGRAADVFRRIAVLEPELEDRLVSLVEGYLAAGGAAAETTWRAVERQLKTARNLGKIGDLLLEWGRYQDAVIAYSRAIKLEPAAVAYWRGRAAARDSLRELAAAIVDGTKVIALATDPADHLAARRELIRIVLHTSNEDESRDRVIGRWHTAFFANPPDLEAGYLLLLFYEKSPCESYESESGGCRGEIVRVVDRLSKLATVDLDHVIAIATAYSSAGQRSEAIEILVEVAKLAPDRKRDIDRRIAQINQWERSAVLSQTYTVPAMTGVLEDPFPEPADNLVRRRGPEALHSPVRGGIRIGAGTGLRGDADHLVTAGLTASVRFARKLSVTSRLDWSERQSAVSSVDAVGFALGVAGSVLTTRDATLALGIAQRVEGRFGKMVEDQTGLATDLTLDLIGRNVPVAVGARCSQGMSDGARDTSVLLELSVELR